MRVSPFSKQFDRASFSCGTPELDAYLKKQLSQDIKKCAAAGFILHEEKDAKILGYYTLSAFSINLANIPESQLTKIPRYPNIPATMLGRIAIDHTEQGKGLGELLLMDALRRSWENRAIIGSWAVVVDAMNSQAASFYKHLNFTPVKGKPNRYFLTMQEIGRLF